MTWHRDEEPGSGSKSYTKRSYCGRLSSISSLAKDEQSGKVDEGIWENLRMPDVECPNLNLIAYFCCLIVLCLSSFYFMYKNSASFSLLHHLWRRVQVFVCYCFTPGVQAMHSHVRNVTGVLFWGWHVLWRLSGCTGMPQIAFFSRHLCTLLGLGRVEFPCFSFAAPTPPRACPMPCSQVTNSNAKVP